MSSIPIIPWSSAQGYPQNFNQKIPQNLPQKGPSSSIMKNGPGIDSKVFLNKATIEKIGPNIVVNNKFATRNVSNGLMNNCVYNRFNSKAYFLYLRI